MVLRGFSHAFFQGVTLPTDSPGLTEMGLLKSFRRIPAVYATLSDDDVGLDASEQLAQRRAPPRAVSLEHVGNGELRAFAAISASVPDLRMDHSKTEYFKGIGKDAGAGGTMGRRPFGMAPTKLSDLTADGAFVFLDILHFVHSLFICVC